VLYGALSLWVPRAPDSDSLKQQVCEYWLCPAPANDSPAAITLPPDEPLAEARRDLSWESASAYRWADLANSEINANQLQRARFCERQALAAAPGSPAILFRAANFYLRLEDYPETLRQLTQVLRNPDLAKYYDRVFAIYSQMDLPLEDLLNQGLPRTSAAGNTFLHFWVRQNKPDEADETFAWMAKNSLTNLQSAGSYASLLAKDGRWEEAAQAWSAYTSRLNPTYQKTNWVYNGSFERELVDCPFDWRFKHDDAMEVARDPDSGYKGSASLRIHFTTTPKGDAIAAYQMVMLAPGRWQLKAAMKTQQLTGGHGVVIRVVDANDPARLDVSTDTFARTREWTQIEKVFDVGAQARLARVEILLPQFPDLDIGVEGTVWMDAIELAPAL
jgi:tetratricopeptide (TPR) repeat protein